MELYVKLYDRDNYDVLAYQEENREIVSNVISSKQVPDEVKIMNKDPEQDFLKEVFIVGKENLTRIPAKQILVDLLDDQSSLCRYFDCANDDGKKTAVFLNIWQKCFSFVIDRSKSSFMKDKTKYEVLFGNPLVDEIGVLSGEFRGPYFVTRIPKELIKKHYPNPVCYISELKDAGYQQFFDLKKLDKDEFIEYAAAPYYVELSEDYNNKLRGDVIKMRELSKIWIDTLFAALG